MHYLEIATRDKILLAGPSAAAAATTASSSTAPSPPPATADVDVDGDRHSSDVLKNSELLPLNSERLDRRIGQDLDPVSSCLFEQPRRVLVEFSPALGRGVGLLTEQ